MNTFQPLNTVLMAEALAIVLLILAAIVFLAMKRKSKDRSAVGTLIQSIGLTTDQHALELEERLSEIPGMDEEMMQAMLASAKQNEKALYQHIITLYLKRDARMLNQLSLKVDGLTNPYMDAMSKLVGIAAANPDMSEELKALQDKLDEATREKRRLSKELRTVSNTLEEVSDEYAQMFGGSRGIEEISASRKRMLRIIENSIKDLGGDPSDDLQADPLEGLPR